VPKFSWMETQHGWDECAACTAVGVIFNDDRLQEILKLLVAALNKHLHEGVLLCWRLLTMSVRRLDWRQSCPSMSLGVFWGPQAYPLREHGNGSILADMTWVKKTRQGAGMSFILMFPRYDHASTQHGEYLASQTQGIPPNNP